MRFSLLILFLLIPFCLTAQPTQEEERLIANLTFGSSLPAGILAARSLVLHEPAFTQQELQEAQKYFQQAGIDAVSYLDIDYVLSGPDPSGVFSNYFEARQIKFLIILQKSNNGYQSIITEYNGTKSFVDKQHPSWKQSNPTLLELLRTIYRFTVSTQKKENFLINDIPETGFELNFFKGQPSERFAPDVRTFKSAVPRWGNEADDKALELFLKENFPVKYELVDPALTDAELEEKGYRLVLRYVHTRGDAARDILGYDISQTASSLSTYYFAEGESKIKTVSAKKIIYKFYFKNTEYGNVFLGSKWDADATWQDALKNHLLALRQELRF